MKIGKYFTTNHIIEGLIIALLLSAFIYIQHFDILNEVILYIINSILGTYGLYRLLKFKAKYWFFAGFFIGIFWFWWLGVSFYYYNLTYLIPFVILLIGLIYGAIFAFVAYIARYISLKLEDKLLIDRKKSIYFLKAVAIVAINNIHPFKFDWFNLEYIFANSAYGSQFWQFGLILFALSLYLTFKRWYILLLLLPVIDLRNAQVLPPSHLQYIKLISTNVSVKDKWKPQNFAKYTQFTLKQIDKAIKDKKELIIFPESFLPYFLNLEQPYLYSLLERSKKITIIIGSLYYKAKGEYKNSAYIIKDGNYTIANKVVLVPFGESNPLPDFLGKYINKIFYDGAVDYGADKEFTYIKALNKRFKIAICYEGTSKITYQDNPKFLILLSNDGWFYPSIEPTLQKIILSYFAKVYGTTIYHSINGHKSYIVVPHP